MWLKINAINLFFHLDVIFSKPIVIGRNQVGRAIGIATGTEEIAMRKVSGEGIVADANGVTVCRVAGRDVADFYLVVPTFPGSDDLAVRRRVGAVGKLVFVVVNGIVAAGAEVVLVRDAVAVGIAGRRADDCTGRAVRARRASIAFRLPEVRVEVARIASQTGSLTCQIGKLTGRASVAFRLPEVRVEVARIASQTGSLTRQIGEFAWRASVAFRLPGVRIETSGGTIQAGNLTRQIGKLARRAGVAFRLTGVRVEITCGAIQAGNLTCQIGKLARRASVAFRLTGVRVEVARRTQIRIVVAGTVATGRADFAVTRSRLEITCRAGALGETSAAYENQEDGYD